MREIDLSELPAILRTEPLDLIRRGADGSLRLSTDRWRLTHVGDCSIDFDSVIEDPGGTAQQLSVPLDSLDRLTWDRLPKQRTRAQVRFHLRGGDLWTFSGRIQQPADV